MPVLGYRGRRAAGGCRSRRGLRAGDAPQRHLRAHARGRPAGHAGDRAGGPAPRRREEPRGVLGAPTPGDVQRAPAVRHGRELVRPAAADDAGRRRSRPGWAHRRRAGAVPRGAPGPALGVEGPAQLPDASLLARRHRRPGGGGDRLPRARRGDGLVAPTRRVLTPAGARAVGALPARGGAALARAVVAGGRLRRAGCRSARDRAPRRGVPRSPRARRPARGGRRRGGVRERRAAPQPQRPGGGGGAVALAAAAGRSVARRRGAGGRRRRPRARRRDGRDRVRPGSDAPRTGRAGQGIGSAAVAKIGVVHIGWYGHVGPANRLTGVLAAQGHELVAWAPPPFQAAIEAAGARLRPLGDWEMERLRAWDQRRVERWAPRPDDARPRGDGLAGHGFSRFAAEMAEATPLLAEPLIEALHAEGVELVAHDAMTPWARVAADFLGLPRLCSFPGHPPPWPLGLGQLADAEAETLDAAREEVGRRWGVELGDAASVLVSPGDLTMVYSTPEVIGTAMPDDSWQLVGPLMGPPSDPAGEPALAGADGRPLVYVAFGTTFNYRFDVFQAVLDGLAAADVQVVLSTGGRDPAEIGTVPANATVVPHVDSRAVLARAAAHVTHGGANSVHESLIAAVPMVCVPQG